MIKFKAGSVTNPETGVERDIIVKAKLPNELLDILIWGGMVVVGITGLTCAAFKKGAKSFDEAEFRALSDADLIGELPK